MKTQPVKSIVRVMWAKMYQANAETLTEKKNICKEVLEEAISNHYIVVHTAKYMLDKIMKMRSHQALQAYLVNSKNYFEKNFVYTIS